MRPPHNAKCASEKKNLHGKYFKFLMLMFTQHSLYLIYALLSQIQLCRNSALFGEALLAKVWWGEARKHFKGPGGPLRGVEGLETCPKGFYSLYFCSKEVNFLLCCAFHNAMFQGMATLELSSQTSSLKTPLLK